MKKGYDVYKVAKQRYACEKALVWLYLNRKKSLHRLWHECPNAYWLRWWIWETLNNDEWEKAYSAIVQARRNKKSMPNAVRKAIPFEKIYEAIKYI